MLVVAGRAAPVSFTVNVRAGPAAYVAVERGDNQFARPGSSVKVAPSVSVRDLFGNAVAGARVTFAVSTGGGSLTGASSTTDSSGLAALGGWLLGAPGEQAVTALVDGVVTPATFHAIATLQPCVLSRTLTLDVAAIAQLSVSSCPSATGAFLDYFDVSIRASGSYTVVESPIGFGGRVVWLTGDGIPLADSDPRQWGGDGAPVVTATARAFLPAGQYRVAATSLAPGQTGTYGMIVSAAPPVISGCEIVFVSRGVSTEQVLRRVECGSASSALASVDGPADLYRIYLRAGEPVTISMSSDVLDAHLALANASGNLVAANEDTDYSTNSLIQYVPSVSGYYVIGASSSYGVGKYILSIDR